MALSELWLCCGCGGAREARPAACDRKARVVLGLRAEDEGGCDNVGEMCDDALAVLVGVVGAAVELNAAVEVIERLLDRHVRGRDRDHAADLVLAGTRRRTEHARSCFVLVPQFMTAPPRSNKFVNAMACDRNATIW